MAREIGDKEVALRLRGDARGLGEQEGDGRKDLIRRRVAQGDEDLEVASVRILQRERF